MVYWANWLYVVIFVDQTLEKMKISYNWLKQFLNLEWGQVQISELLTDLGLEVEGVHNFESVKGSLEGVVVGHITACVAHPNADSLQLTTVELGQENPVQIVCGAPNARVGLKVAVATIGTTIYLEDGDSFKIKKGKIRGEYSYGMLCSEKELGLGASNEGILELDTDVIPGTPLSSVYEVEQDTIFEIGLTPNRADAMSHWGVARDLKAGLLQKGVKLELIDPSVMGFRVENRLDKIDVNVENSALCTRFCGVMISGVKVTSSPQWLQNRLKSIGITPKNNIVDVTNYVMHNLGQPLHAYDSKSVSSGKLKVKTLPQDTPFVTLDGQELKLHSEDLVICNQNDTPLCIAGVMGGKSSGVHEYTEQVFLESAYFDPVSIRKTSKRHGLKTDASFRFERGIDPKATKYALKHAALLIQEVAGGDITSDIVEVYPTKVEDIQVFISFENVNNLVGQVIDPEQIKSILSSLEIKINSITDKGLGLSIPPYRNDVTREADVIEEILRIYGYNNIGFSDKLNASIAKIVPVEPHKVQNTVANQLVASGFYEIMTNSLTSDKYHEIPLRDFDALDAVSLLNPLSSDLGVLRQSVLFSGLEVISFNQKRQSNRLKFFEFGKTYYKKHGSFQENTHLSLLITGEQFPESWLAEKKQTSFFFLKRTVTLILESLGFVDFETCPVDVKIFSEGLSIFYKEDKIVDFGVVSPAITSEFQIETPVLYADFKWDVLLRLLTNKRIRVINIPKFQEVRRDFSLLVDKHITFKEIRDTAVSIEKKILKNVNLFDVFESDKLPEGKKSYAVSFHFLDTKKTLTDKQVDKVMSKFQSSFEKDLGAILR